MTTKPKLLIVSDSITLNTGFATVAKNLASRLKVHWDISILAAAYTGDYHPAQLEYKLYTTGEGLYGAEKIIPLITAIQPDLVFFINDPWVCSKFVVKVRSKFPDIPIICYTPVDASNLKIEYVQPLNLASHLVAYTQFGKQELVKSGLEIPITIIPHGVDTELFKPIDKTEARNTLGFPQDIFIVLNINANNPRKNLDFFFFLFAEWIKQYKRDDAYVYYHGALKGEALDVEQWCEYLGIGDRLIVTDKRFSQVGIPAQHLPTVYGVADLYMTACANEGWGLTLHEAMAMALPCIAPHYAAVSEWANGGFYKLPVEKRYPKSTHNGLNTLHYLSEYEASIQALEDMYLHANMREKYSAAGYTVATQDRFQWDTIAKQFNSLFFNELGKVNS